MSEKLINVNRTNKLRIYKTVSPTEVRGRHYKLVADPSTISGERWTRQPDLTLYRWDDGVWRTQESGKPVDREEMRDWVADFDIRDSWVS